MPETEAMWAGTGYGRRVRGEQRDSRQDDCLSAIELARAAQQARQSRMAPPPVVAAAGAEPEPEPEPEPEQEPGRAAAPSDAVAVPTAAGGDGDPRSYVGLGDLDSAGLKSLETGIIGGDMLQFFSAEVGSRLTPTRAPAESPPPESPETASWEQLWEWLSALGWSTERSGPGRRSVYFPPGTRRKHAGILGRDYFDTKDSVREYMCAIAALQMPTTPREAPSASSSVGSCDGSEGDAPPVVALTESAGGEFRSGLRPPGSDEEDEDGDGGRVWGGAW